MIGKGMAKSGLIVMVSFDVEQGKKEWEKSRWYGKKEMKEQGTYLYFSKKGTKRVTQFFSRANPQVKEEFT